MTLSRGEQGCRDNIIVHTSSELSCCVNWPMYVGRTRVSFCMELPIIINSYTFIYTASFHTAHFLFGDHCGLGSHRTSDHMIMSAHEKASLRPRGACYSSYNTSVKAYHVLVFVATLSSLCCVTRFLYSKYMIHNVHEGVHSNSM